MSRTIESTFRLEIIGTHNALALDAHYARFLAAFVVDGARDFTIDLSCAGPLDDRTCQTIADIFAAIHGDLREGPRAKLTIAGVDDAQLAILRAARLTNCIPVERRTPAPLELTSEIDL